MTVTESKFLHDSHLDIDVEVDVVIEGLFEGEHLTLSVEVVEHGRPVDVTWVQRQIARHEYLPTNKLLLVSRSGFSKNAEIAAGKYEHRVALAGTGEMGDLVRAFNHMAADLDASRQLAESSSEQLTAANRAYREVVGFVSHELKSPLASLVMDGEKPRAADLRGEAYV